MLDTLPHAPTMPIADAIDAIGQPGFLPALAALCQGVSGYTSTFVIAAFPDAPPVGLFDNLTPSQTARAIPPYLDFAYLLDPFHVLYRKGIGDAVVTLGDAAPDDFLHSDYYHAYYADTGLYDETGLFVGFEGGAALILSLGSRDPGFSLSPRGHAGLQDLLPVLASLCRRHWPRLAPGMPGPTGRIGLHLEKSFERFGRSRLSAREAQIVRLILKGHSSKSIARRLGNSPETVKVHRKRIYSKLGIASQGELFSVFLDALARTPPNATSDPLIYL